MNARSTSEQQERQSIQLESPFLSNRLNCRLNQLDRAATRLMARYGLRLLSISMGLVFVWFGALKVVDLSPAEPLIRATLRFLPGTLVNPLILLLAIWEVAIGIGFLSGKAKRLVLLLLLLQMGAAMSPLILTPERLWATFPSSGHSKGSMCSRTLCCSAPVWSLARRIVGAACLPGALSTCSQ